MIASTSLEHAAARASSPPAGEDRRVWYREVYLQSDHWRETRRKAINRAGGRCVICNTGGMLDVHHRTYERLGAEDPADLTVLCQRCHSLFHRRLHPAPGADRPKTKPKRKRKPKPVREHRPLRMSDYGAAVASYDARQAAHKAEKRA